MNKLTDLYAVYGASGFGREVMPLARAQLANDLQTEDYTLVFIDDDACAGKSVNGHAAMTYSSFIDAPAKNKYAVIAIASSSVREQLALRCAQDGVRPFSICASNSSRLDANSIGEGAIFCSYSHVTSNASIGKHFHANIYSYVAHDCVVGDFVTLAPGAKINGNVILEDGAYIGTGAIIKQGQPGKPVVIGRRAVVGMGAVVTKSVPPDTVVIGNPARPLAG